MAFDRKAYLKVYTKTPKFKERVRQLNLGWKRRYARCRYTAKLHNILFDLTQEQFQKIADSPCIYCGDTFKGFGHGLDRALAGGPYSVDNVVSCCDTCNMVKHDSFTYDEMLQLGAVVRSIKAVRPNAGHTVRSHNK